MFDVTPSTGDRQWEPPTLGGASISDLHSPNSASVAAYTKAIEAAKNTALRGGVQSFTPMSTAPVSLEEKLYEAKATCKITTAIVSMHLQRNWRQALFNQLDALMDIEDWNDEEQPVTEASYRTFLRLLLLKGVNRRPGIGAHEGDIVAAWVNGKDRLTVQCKAHDKVSWTIALHDGPEPEYAASNCHLNVLMKRLNSYNPERWFDEAKKIEPEKNCFKTIEHESIDVAGVETK